MSLPRSVTIREVGPREGFQTLSRVVSTNEKLELISALNRTGVCDIEIASFVRPDRVPQMADVNEVVSGVEQEPRVRYTALYLNQTGFKLAEASKKLQNGGWLTVSPSASFLKNNGNTTPEQVVAEVPSWIALFSEYKKSLDGLMVSMAFGCNIEGEISHEKLIQCIDSVLAAAGIGKKFSGEICLADTVGLGNPEEVRRRINIVRDNYSDATVSLHLHDTRGTGMANVYAGLLEGVSIFDSSVGGMGGCPFAKGAAGNVPTEDVAYLCETLGIETNLNLSLYAEAARIAERIVGHELPGKFYKVK